ncbi:TPA: hypothetical protein JI107_17670 [Acinetobacter baumannii]|nr:hypothetical protein [Acinetobacter baumannii]
MSKVYCIGGFLAGKEVEFVGETFIPLSKEDPRDYFLIGSKEINQIEQPLDTYHFYRIHEVRDFYIWNNQPELKENLGNKYINNEV